MTINVGVALSPRDWRGSLQRHCRDHEADLVVHLLHEGRDAFDVGVDVVLVDDDTSWLSAPFVNQARDVGVSLVGLFDPAEADGHGRQHLQRLGVSCQVSADLVAEELVDLVRIQRPDPTTAGRFEAMTTELSQRRPVAERRIIAVGGPAGAGATEVSVALVQSLAQAGQRALLVDVDETHPSLARRLGLGLHPHLLTAVDLARGEVSTAEALPNEPARQPSFDTCLAQSALGRSGLPFDVITGLATRDDWPLVRADDVVELLTELSAHWPVVVARLGPQLEDLSRYVDRFEVSRATAARADRVLAVCDGSPTGLLRFVDWLVDALSLIGDAPIDVVVNRSSPSGSAAQQMVDQLREIAGERLGQIAVVPRDRRIERAAWDASLVFSGPFLRSISRVASSVREAAHA